MLRKDERFMKEYLRVAKEYVEGLQLRQKESEEVENVIAGYMSDCVAKDKLIDKLEAENARLRGCLKDWNIHYGSDT